MAPWMTYSVTVDMSSENERCMPTITQYTICSFERYSMDATHKVHSRLVLREMCVGSVVRVLVVTMVLVLCTGRIEYGS